MKETNTTDSMHYQNKQNSSRVKIDYDLLTGYGVLLCPHCGDECLHQSEVETFERNEDERIGMYTKVCGNRTIVERNPLDRNPSSRRQGMRIAFWCEACQSSLELLIYQHKGVTFVKWQTVERGDQ